MSHNLAMQILTEEDRYWAAGVARRFAAELAFSATEQARLALCVAELASNMARHAGRGSIELTAVDVPQQGCWVRARDGGPGIVSVTEALRDGFSEGRWLTPDAPRGHRRGLGIGLGAVRRLMSEVRMGPHPDGGFLIEAVLWRAPRVVYPSNKED